MNVSFDNFIINIQVVLTFFIEPVTISRDVSVDSLLGNTYRLPQMKEFEELQENDRNRSGIKSKLTMAQGRRYNDGSNGQMNIKKDILPYDQNRVKLKTNINGVDYINGSWIQRVKEERVYDDLYEFLPSSRINFILTQDPTLDTQHHFYQMLFEQKIDIVAHIGSVDYAPEWKKASFGNMTKELVE